MCKKGITIVEIALVIAIIAIIAGLAVPFYRVLQTQNELEITVSTAANKIRKAQIFAQAGERDSNWGVSIQEDELIFFKGENFENRNQDFDEIFSIAPIITTSGLDEVVFNKLTGIPQTSGTITFTSISGEEKTISINQKGMVSYETLEVEDPEDPSIFCGGEGTVAAPYLICNANDLNEIREDLSAHYKLSNDIDLNVSPYNEGNGWDPIGDSGNMFTGTLEGNGKIIEGLYINRSAENYVGLFGYLSATPGQVSNITNLGLVDVDITGGEFTGGITGYIAGVWNAEGKILNSYVSGNIKGGGSTGGISGYTAYRSRLENVYSRCDIEGGWGTGGISGSHWGGNNFIENSYSASQLNTGGGKGGVIGQGSSSVINTYWDIDLYPTSPLGTGKTTEEMKEIETFTNWDIGTNHNNINDGYPYLGWQINNDDFIWLIYNQ